MLVVKVYYKIETSLWALTLTAPVPETFEAPASDWPEKKTISGQSAKPDDSSFFLHDEESFPTKC